jgi:hypothetical protein
MNSVIARGSQDIVAFQGSSSSDLFIYYMTVSLISHYLASIERLFGAHRFSTVLIDTIHWRGGVSFHLISPSNISLRILSPNDVVVLPEARRPGTGHVGDEIGGLSASFTRPDFPPILPPVPLPKRETHPVT